MSNEQSNNGISFPLGNTIATSGAVNILSHEEMVALIRRHASGDWGDLCQEDKDLNVNALKHGDRILSCYNLKGEKFYVITEADRSVTTLLLAEDY